VRLEVLGQLKKIHLFGTRTRDLPACSIVPQRTTLPRALGEESMYFTYLVTETDSALYRTIKCPKSEISFEVKRVSVEK
jgi:hypothetical protein